MTARSLQQLVLDEVGGRAALDAAETAPAPQVAIILPAYNEAAAIAATIADYQAAFPQAQILVIDNNSADGTSAEAAPALRPQQDLLLSERRQGKGHAVKKGLSRVEADIYIMTDADATYRAADARRLYEMMIAGRHDMVVGDRQAGGTYQKQNRRAGHSLGNKVMSAIISRLAGQEFGDVFSGLRVMSRPFVQQLDIRSAGFQLETELNVLAARLRADIVESPIAYDERPAGSQSKLNTIRDGLRILGFALTNWVAFSPLQPFSYLAAAMFFGVGAFGVRVAYGWAATGYAEMPYPNSAVAAVACAIIGVQALFTGLSLHIGGQGARRRDIAHFLEDRRAWNARLDGRIARN